MRRQIAVHQGMKLSDRQAVLELVPVIGPFARSVDFPRRKVTVSKHPQNGEVKLRSQGVLRPFHHRVDIALGASARNRKIVFLQTANLFGPHDGVVMTVAHVHNTMLDNLCLGTALDPRSEGFERLDSLVHFNGNGPK